METKSQISIVPFILVASLFLGGNVLDVLGYMQSDPTSSPIFRLHPSTYLLFFLWAIQSIKSNTLFNSANNMVRFYAIVVLAVFVFSVTLGKTKANFFILDTLFASVLLVQLIQNASDDLKYKLLYWLQFFFVCNCLLAIGERAMSRIVFQPIEQSFFESFRSYALTGHPLNSALITSSLTLFFVVFSDSTQKKFLYFGLGMLALFAFGARASLGTMMVAFPFLLYLDLKNYESDLAAGKFFNYLLLFSIAIVACWYVLAFTSFGERIFNSSRFDDDSADVRSRVFDLFNHFTLSSLLWGISEGELLTAMYLEKVDIIENFWIVWIFKYGVILTVILGVTLFIFLLALFRNAGPLVKFILAIQFLLAASSNNSLAVNTTAVSIVALAALVGFNAFSIQSNQENKHEDICNNSGVQSEN